jgi:hypothetical protein
LILLKRAVVSLPHRRELHVVSTGAVRNAWIIMNAVKSGVLRKQKGICVRQLVMIDVTVNRLFKAMFLIESEEHGEVQ